MKNEYKNVVWTDKPHNFFGLAINFTRFTMTETKLYIRKGFLNIREDEIELYRVIDKSVELPLAQRIFGCGTIILNAKDVNVPIVRLAAIKDPRAVSELIGEKIDGLRQKYQVQGRDMYGAAAKMEEHGNCEVCEPDDSKGEYQ